MLKNKVSKIISVAILVLLVFFFRVPIKNTYNKIYKYFKPETTQEQKPKEEEQIFLIETTSCSSIPSAEKIETSGIANRESIKFISEGFKEIEYIVPKSTSFVKKGDLLIKFSSKDIELQAEELRKEIEIKERIFDRNQKLREIRALSLEELDKIQIELVSAKGKLRHLEFQIEDSKKLAPFDCLIKHHGIIDQSVVSNGQEIITVYRKDKIYVDVNINISDYNKLEEKVLLGKNVRVKFGEKRILKGKVIYFINNVDPYAASLSATIEIQEEDDQITSGELCTLKIYTGVLNRYFSVPEEAICGEDYDLHVFVIKQGIAYKTNVKIIGKKGNKVMISGISEGDVIAVAGAHRLSNLVKVRV